MGRMYIAEFSIAAHTAQIDYFELLTVTEKPVLLHGWEFGQLSEVGDAQEEFLQLVLKRVTGAPTSGSGGSAAAAGNPTTPNDTAGSATFEFGNTTKLTGGTQVNLPRFAWNVRTPCVFWPPPEGRITVAGATRLVLEELTTPADSITGPAGYVLYEELV
jgi:hypothetical protein